MKRYFLLLFFLFSQNSLYSQQLQKLIQKADSLFEKKNYFEAVKIYLQTSELGDARSQNRIGYFFLSGTGIEKDTTKAIQYFQMSANQGYAKAQYNLGERYYFGQGVTKDWKIAFELFSKSAQQGFAPAQSFIGEMYYLGSGTERNNKFAEDWFLKSSNQGDINSKYFLGVIYYYGETGKFDIKKAIELITFASENGDDRAKRLLAKIYSSPKFEYVEPFNDGYAKVKLNGYYGVIDKNGELVIPNIYENLGRYVRKGIICFREDNKWGFIDTSKKIITLPKYDEEAEFWNGFATVKINNKCSFLNKKGKEIIPFIYDNIGSFKNGLATFSINNKYGIIDTLGKVLVQPFYDYMNSFSEGLCEVKLNNKYGFINTKGEIQIPIIYDYVQNFHEGLAFVQQKTIINNKNYESGKYINSVGEEAFKMPYTNVQGSDFSNGFAVLNSNLGIKYTDNQIIDSKGKIYYNDRIHKVKMFFKVYKGLFKANSNITDKTGYIDKFGNKVVPPIYDEISDFEDDIAAFQLGNTLGFVNSKGVEIFKTNKYEEVKSYRISEFYEGLMPVRFNGKWGFIDINGNEKIGWLK